MQTKIIDQHDANLLIKWLYWADQHQYFCYFNPNGYKKNHGGFKHFLSVGSEAISSDNHSLKTFQNESENSHSKWVGYFSYDLKDELGHASTSKNQTIAAPHLQFFKAETNIYFNGDQLLIESEKDVDKLFEQVNSIQVTEMRSGKMNLIPTTSKAEYIANCNKIKEDIIRGEYYEINYCIEFIAENTLIDPIDKYLKLNDLSPMPFSCLAKFEDQYVICASPERFLKRSGNTVISQPIKGTIRRGRDKQEDEKLKTILRNSQKELAENMMIIDLVRNDLNINAKTGTVQVDEFFGIYTFKQIHQMISTISCKVDPEKESLKVIKDAFPMGSMTGAPKKRVISAIDEYEKNARGIYSGALGYFDPGGDFDFNVIIRSIIYDRKYQKLSFHVGSAITYDADPEYEYEECMLKAQSMMSILSEL